jgi:hypothetical protein
MAHKGCPFPVTFRFFSVVHLMVTQNKNSKPYENKHKKLQMPGGGGWVGCA